MPFRHIGTSQWRSSANLRRARKSSDKRVNHFPTMHVRHCFVVRAFSESPYERLFIDIKS